MLRSTKQLYSTRLTASDGDLGEVKDFYFDDQNWAVRYVVAETGKWLINRQVLLPRLAWLLAGWGGRDRISGPGDAHRGGAR